jgi:aminoglycoside 6'-N-acetyltransferase I
MDITIRRITKEDKLEWLRMRRGIWPDWTDEYLIVDLDHILASQGDLAIFACVDGKPIGLTEVRIRDFGEGCETSPVGYLEGWFVDEEYRGKGIVAVLTQVAEDWVREKGCTEMASDTWLENAPSIRAHLKMGYKEVERLVHYVKRL